MFKCVFRIFGIMICTLVILSCSACSIGGNQPSKINSSITKLSKPYEGSNLKITATDIKATPSRPLFDSKSDGIIIGVRFIVENVSNKDIIISRSNVDAYVDDISARLTYERDFDKDGENLMGKIAPGKRTIGYYCVKASKDAKHIEIHFKEDYSTKYATFMFDVPPVEE